MATGRTMGNDSRHGVSATMIFAEYLAQEAPDGGNRVVHPVAILDSMFVKDLFDTGFS